MTTAGRRHRHKFTYSPTDELQGNPMSNVLSKHINTHTHTMTCAVLHHNSQRLSREADVIYKYWIKTLVCACVLPLRPNSGPLGCSRIFAVTTWRLTGKSISADLCFQPLPVTAQLLHWQRHLLCRFSHLEQECVTMRTTWPKKNTFKFLLQELSFWSS